MINLRYLLFIFLSLNLCVLAANEPDIRKQHVAFVFAGSARSFVMPLVHESIRHNLLNALCPRKSCVKDVFIRVSDNDNTHRDSPISDATKNAKGHSTPLSAESITLIEHAVNRLMVEPGHLQLQWYSIGSRAEEDEMKASFDSMRHKIFRDLDSRRYSMFFSRWASYQMAVREEQKTGRRFDWIVMARLDTMWGSPVAHISAFSPLKMWVLDRWQIDIPDAFAIIPRDFADGFFSMEGLVVPCGPNFDPTTINEANLLSLGFSSSDISSINNNLCDTQFQGDPNSGLSEAILSRKLNQFKIFFKSGDTGSNIGYAPFFMLIVRYPQTPDCANLRTDFFLENLMRDDYAASAVLEAGCRTLFNDIRLINLNNATANFSTCMTPPLWSRDEYAGDCLLNRYRTDWNFLPFQILGENVDSCLTYKKVLTSNRRDVKRYYTLRFQPCVDVQDVFRAKRNINFTARYSEYQQFHMYPLLKSPQPIKFVNPLDSTVQCFSETPVKGSLILSGRPCWGSHSTFRFHLLNSKAIKKRAAKKRGQLLENIEKVWIRSSDRPSMCLTRLNTVVDDTDRSEVEFAECSEKNPLQTFTILRTEATNFM